MSKNPFPVKRSIKPKKKAFQLVLIRKVGTGFEVSNGSVKFCGPNRMELLDAMDRWEAETYAESRTAKNGSVPAVVSKVPAVKAGKAVAKVKTGKVSRKIHKKPVVKPGGKTTKNSKKKA